MHEPEKEGKPIVVGDRWERKVKQKKEFVYLVSNETCGYHLNCRKN